MTGDAASREPTPAPRSAIATRVLASFGITVLAFAITVGWSVVAQRRTAQDSEELARGYVPVALKLGQLRATQATLATLVDGIPDERNPLSTRLVIETLSSVRRAKFGETRTAMTDGLAAVGDDSTHALAVTLTSELNAAEQVIEPCCELFTCITMGHRQKVIGWQRVARRYRITAAADATYCAGWRLTGNGNSLDVLLYGHSKCFIEAECAPFHPPRESGCRSPTERRQRVAIHSVQQMAVWHPNRPQRDRYLPPASLPAPSRGRPASLSGQFRARSATHISGCD